MFIYAVSSWGDQTLLFVHKFHSLNNLCGYIKYIKRAYSVYLDKNTIKGPVRNKNILILFKLIDDFKWSSLMFRKMDLLLPETDKILYLHRKPDDKNFILISSVVVETRQDKPLINSHNSADYHTPSQQLTYTN